MMCLVKAQLYICHTRSHKSLEGHRLKCRSSSASLHLSVTGVAKGTQAHAISHRLAHNPQEPHHHGNSSGAPKEVTHNRLTLKMAYNVSVEHNLIKKSVRRCATGSSTCVSGHVGISKDAVFDESNWSRCARSQSISASITLIVIRSRGETQTREQYHQAAYLHVLVLGEPVTGKDKKIFLLPSQLLYFWIIPLVTHKPCFCVYKTFACVYRPKGIVY